MRTYAFWHWICQIGTINISREKLGESFFAAKAKKREMSEIFEIRETDKQRAAEELNEPEDPSQALLVETLKVCWEFFKFQSNFLDYRSGT